MMEKIHCCLCLFWIKPRSVSSIPTLLYIYHQSWIVKVFYLIVGTTLGVFGFIGFVFIFVLFFFPFLITFNNQIDHNDKIGLLDKT